MKHKNEPLHSTEWKAELESFEDERLQKLWEKAKKGMFSDDELRIYALKLFSALHKELKDAERKTRIYKDVLQETNKVAEFLAFRIPVENSILHDETASIEDKKSQLKKAYREMSDHIEQLTEKLKDDKTTLFENERVRRLWKATDAMEMFQAQTNGNFSEHDLNVMKEELTHFDKQLKKMAFHKTGSILQQELEARRAERAKQGKMLLHTVEDVELEAKHEKMDRKLRKMEKYLEAKTRHMEL
ncbi:unnamed protein product [Cylicostephanus goldi]|uniref:Alpha-2-macroglobulin RAP C-terminal domain-containing protein n=1 Tax=Cylicostephanus goldi TaxID=71465 RepID=A0A3P6TUM0_CYLGO|nr:unnamed protein product [Cylicostephanus goldi]